VPALEILAAALLVFGSVLVFRVLIETDQLLDEDAPALDSNEVEAEELPSFRQAA
jgi:hypothetical protein